MWGITTHHMQDTGKLLKAYLQVKDALVNSDEKVATAAIKVFSETLAAEADLQKTDIAKATAKLAKANDLEKQRVAFADVSTAMWQLAEKAGELPADVYYQYCPMKKAYWLSTEPDIKNPYYGSKMLTCGSVKEKKIK